MENQRATTATEHRLRTDRRTARRHRQRRRRAPACRGVRRHSTAAARGERRPARVRHRPRRRLRNRQSARPASRSSTGGTLAVAAVLGRFADAELARLLARVLGSGGQTRTLTATSLFWLLLYVGWQAGLGVEAALWLSMGAVVGALATGASQPDSPGERVRRRVSETAVRPCGSRVSESSTQSTSR